MENGWNYITGTKNIIDKCLFYFLYFMLMTMLALIIIQIASRFILKIPSTYTDESIRFLLVWMCLLGATYGFGQKKHIAVEIFSSRLKGIPFHILDIVLSVFSIYFITMVLIYGGVRLMMLVYTQTTPSLGISMSIIYAVVPVSGIISLLYFIIAILEDVYNIINFRKITKIQEQE